MSSKRKGHDGAINVNFSTASNHVKDQILMAYAKRKGVGQKAIQFHNDEILVVSPEGTPESKKGKLIEFQRNVKKPPRIFHMNNVPLSFLKAAV